MDTFAFFIFCWQFSNIHKDKVERLPFDQDVTKIIAHRGLTSEHLENTISALKASFDGLPEGADGVEFDVQLSKDLVPIVFHDRELERLTGIKANIDDKTAEELAAIKQRNTLKYSLTYDISTLDDVLQALPNDKLINVELKETTILHGEKGMANVVKILKKHIHKRLLISSFDPDILQMVHDQNEGLVLGLLIDHEKVKRSLFHARNVMSFVDILIPHISLVNPRTSQKIKSLPNVNLIFWGHKGGDDGSIFSHQHVGVISDAVNELLILYRQK